VLKADNDHDLYLTFDYMDADLHSVVRSNVLLPIHKKYIMYQLVKALKCVRCALCAHCVRCRCCRAPPRAALLRAATCAVAAAPTRAAPAAVAVAVATARPLLPSPTLRRLHPRPARRYIHSAELIHRDVKPSNILLSSQCALKLCDFGLMRSLAEPEGPSPVLTDYVATRWYRPPEVLLGSTHYATSFDMWSAGCVLGEMLIGQPMFHGTSTMNQVEKILEVRRCCFFLHAPRTSRSRPRSSPPSRAGLRPPQRHRRHRAALPVRGHHARGHAPDAPFGHRRAVHRRTH
jgi:serine/threonine protein kinase